MYCACFAHGKKEQYRHKVTRERPRERKNSRKKRKKNPVSDLIGTRQRIKGGAGPRGAPAHHLQATGPQGPAAGSLSAAGGGSPRRCSGRRHLTSGFKVHGSGCRVWGQGLKISGNAEDLKLAVATPQEHRYLTMAMTCENITVQSWLTDGHTVDNEMKAEGNTDRYCQICSSDARRDNGLL